jgi:hypothetical protein
MVFDEEHPDMPAIQRAKVQGGWLVSVVRDEEPHLAFLLDSEHKWDGNSLP